MRVIWAESDVAVHARSVIEREPTAAEDEFVEVLAGQIPDLQDWYQVDDDGRPWMMVSYDVVRDHAIRATWRLDFDGDYVLGGLSPAFLNWDAETRAAAVGVDTAAPDGIEADVTSPREAALIAADWFRQRIIETRRRGISGRLSTGRCQNGYMHIVQLGSEDSWLGLSPDAPR